MGVKLAYYLFLYPLSLLPNIILYFVSDLLYVIINYIAGYRKKVILQNLKNSFPEYSDAKINSLKKGYYKHLCDLIVEGIKNMSISRKSLEERFTFENMELMDDLYSRGKSIIVMGGHYGNWERYALIMGALGKHKQFAIYKPLKNKFINKKSKEMRERYGLQMISMIMTKKYFIKDPELMKSITFGLDQWPSNPKTAYWTDFLNQETPFFQSAEILAKEYDWAVVYCGLDKYKRGYYHGTFELITDDAKSTQEGEIMDSYVQKLEANIQFKPAHWLWSHKRWKKTKKEVFEKVM